MQASHWRDGISLLERALVAAPDHGIIHQELGRELLVKGRSQEALVHLERAVEISPRKVKALIFLAEAKRQAGLPAEAIALYEQALTIQPGNAYAHNNLAANLEVVGRRDEAIAHYRRALELRPDWSTVRQNLERLAGSPPLP